MREKKKKKECRRKRLHKRSIGEIIFHRKESNITRKCPEDGNAKRAQEEKKEQLTARTLPKEDAKRD